MEANPNRDLDGYVCDCGNPSCPDLDISYDKVANVGVPRRVMDRSASTPTSSYVNQDGPLVSALKKLRINTAQNILQCRAGGAVQRCHTVRHQGSYSVAEHSWGVAMLLWYLYPQEAKRLVYYALAHDVPEGLTGDVPSTAKDHDDSALDDMINHTFELPVLSCLDTEDHHILKSCDWLELYLWGKEQLAQGNSFALEITTNLEAHFAKRTLHPIADEYYRILCDKTPVPNRTNLLKSIKESYNYGS